MFEKDIIKCFLFCLNGQNIEITSLLLDEVSQPLISMFSLLYTPESEYLKELMLNSDDDDNDDNVQKITNKKTKVEMDSNNNTMNDDDSTLKDITNDNVITKTDDEIETQLSLTIQLFISHLSSSSAPVRICVKKSLLFLSFIRKHSLNNSPQNQNSPNNLNNNNNSGGGGSGNSSNGINSQYININDVEEDVLSSFLGQLLSPHISISFKPPTCKEFRKMRTIDQIGWLDCIAFVASLSVSSNPDLSTNTATSTNTTTTSTNTVVMPKQTLLELTNEILKICEESMRLTEIYSPTEYPQPHIQTHINHSNNNSSSSSKSNNNILLQSSSSSSILSSSSSTTSNLSYILNKGSQSQHNQNQHQNNQNIYKFIISNHSCMKNDFLRIDNGNNEFPIKSVQFPLFTCYTLHKVLSTGGSKFTSNGEHGSFRPRMTSIFFKILTSPSPISEPAIEVARKALT